MKYFILLFATCLFACDPIPPGGYAEGTNSQSGYNGGFTIPGQSQGSINNGLYILKTEDIIEFEAIQSFRYHAEKDGAPITDDEIYNFRFNKDNTLDLEIIKRSSGMSFTQSYRSTEQWDKTLLKNKGCEIFYRYEKTFTSFGKAVEATQDEKLLQIIFKKKRIKQHKFGPYVHYTYKDNVNKEQ